MAILSHYPNKPLTPETLNSYIILCNTHDTSSAFLNIFHSIRKSRNAKGIPTDEEQDLLRAMLIFSTSGLDSMVKQLIREALPKVISKDEGANIVFTGYIEKRISKDETINTKMIASALVSNDPKEFLIQYLVDDLTSGSLQSKDELLGAASFFNIPSNLITSNFNYLQELFSVRNEISHEMDIDLDQPNRNRRPRSLRKMVSYTNEVFKVAGNFLSEVDARL